MMISSGECRRPSFVNFANIELLAGLFTCNAQRSATLRISTNRVEGSEGSIWTKKY